MLPVGGPPLEDGGEGLLPGGVEGGVLLGGGVGQVALAYTTDPSGRVLVVCGVPDGVSVCVHDGSLGFFEQSTVGVVGPDVQLPAAHVDPDPFSADGAFGIDVLVGCSVVDLLPGIAAAIVALIRLFAALTGGRSLAHFNAAILSSLNNASDMHFVYAFSGVSGKSLAQVNPFLSSLTFSHVDNTVNLACLSTPSRTFPCLQFSLSGLVCITVCGPK